MPMNLADYPPTWKELSRRIRLERAGGQCECMGECGASHLRRSESIQIERCPAHNGDRLKGAGKVVLTVAHLCRPEDHDPPAKCGDETHLLALCQACHLRLDHPLHVRHARETREAMRGYQELAGFGGEVAGTGADATPERAATGGVDRPLGRAQEGPGILNTPSVQAATGEGTGLVPAPRETGVRAPLPEPSSSRRNDAEQVQQPHPAERDDAEHAHGGGDGTVVVPELRQPYHSALGAVEGRRPAEPLRGDPQGDATVEAPPLVAVSDGSQDVDGFAPLEGRPLPPGFRARDLGDGWRTDSIEPCLVCKRGVALRDPAGVPMHRSCAEAR